MTMMSVNLHCERNSSVEADVYIGSNSNWFEFTIDNQNVTVFFKNRTALESFITKVENSFLEYRSRNPIAA
jgi:hypothetical protein